VLAVFGVAIGFVAGFVLERTLGKHFAELKLPGVLPLLISAALILTAAVIASALPAIRASRVDPAEALRSE
jgi:putative ABC transport system permease protein